jgi:4-hydroxy-2-oxoheptanedioate aldolase
VTPAGAAVDGAGLWCQDVTAGFVARAALAGFDWLCLDLQHGTVLRSQLIPMLSGLPAGSPPVAVRVSGNDPAEIGAALDAGARAVIVPSVSTAREAAQAVAASFYPPAGGRSWGQYAGLFGGTPTPPERLNAATLCGVMIETADGYAELEEIASTPGVGMLFIGPYDLSLALGTTVAELLEDGAVLREIVGAAARHGLLAGGYAGTPTVARRMRELGITCIAVADDSWMIAAGAEAALARLRA